MATRLRVTYVKSAIGQSHHHKAIIEALGLRKLNAVVEHPDNPSTWGMVRKVQHLVRVEQVEVAE